jgi:hypothetical protein
MNNVYVSIIGRIVLALVMWLMGVLASHLSKPAWNTANDIIMLLGGPQALALSITGTVASLGLVVWLRLKSKVHLDKALELPEGSTVEDVKKTSPSAMSALKNPSPK